MTKLLILVLLLGVSFGFQTNALAEGKYVCFENMNRPQDYENDERFLRYYSIASLCLHYGDDVTPLVVANHLDQRKLVFNVKSWETGAGFSGVVQTIISFSNAQVAEGQLGKLWISYEENDSRAPMKTFMAYTPDGFDFEGYRTIDSPQSAFFLQKSAE